MCPPRSQSDECLLHWSCSPERRFGKRIENKIHQNHAKVNGLTLLSIAVADLREGAKGRAPLAGQNFFIFMHFLGKIGQIVCWPPIPLQFAPILWEILDPPLNRFFPVKKSAGRPSVYVLSVKIRKHARFREIINEKQIFLSEICQIGERIPLTIKKSHMLVNKLRIMTI